MTAICRQFVSILRLLPTSMLFSSYLNYGTFSSFKLILLTNDFCSTKAREKAKPIAAADSFDRIASGHRTPNNTTNASALCPAQFAGGLYARVTILLLQAFLNRDTVAVSVRRNYRCDAVPQPSSLHSWRRCSLCWHSD